MHDDVDETIDRRFKLPQEQLRAPRGNFRIVLVDKEPPDKPADAEAIDFYLYEDCGTFEEALEQATVASNEFDMGTAIFDERGSMLKHVSPPPRVYTTISHKRFAALLN